MNEEHVPPTPPKGEATGQRPLRLFLKSPKAEVSSQPPSWLARRMGLHLYSNVLLTKKVRTEMNFAAGLLLLVSVFEWLLWTLLFNGIYNSDIFNLGLTTIPAALTGLFFGFAVFWFERQMLTSSGRGWLPRFAMFCRFVYIVVAALITSQTFELMLFQKPIQARAREEAVRANAAKHYQEVIEAEKQASNPSDYVYVTTGPESDALKMAQAELKKLESDRRWWSLQAARAQYDGNLARAAQLNRLLLDSAPTLTALREKVQRAEQSLIDQGHEVELKIEALKQRAADQRQRFREWAGQLRVAEENGGDALEKGKRPDDPEAWTYEEPKPLFFEQLFLLADLMTGRPAGWPGAGPEVRADLRNKFGFYEPPACPDPEASPQFASTAGPQQAAELRDIALDCERRRSSTSIFFWSWVAGLGTAMLIPMLILIIKIFLLPEELRFYYSRPHQAELGDVEALNIHQAEERLRTAKTHEKRS
jgi:Domain of unknown function (DUF4407)